MSDRHRHNWKIFTEGKTGGFVTCNGKDCGALVFLPKNVLRKFKRLLASGIKPTQIEVTVKW